MKAPSPACRGFSAVVRSVSAAAILLILAPEAGSADPGYPSDSLNMFSAEPEPFRQDEVDPRDDFEYSDESFLHRYSYRLRTDWQRLWDEEREGFVITAGSTRTDELFVMHLLRKTIDLDETFFAVFRHQREEDFDSRYDRFLTGVGGKLGGGWSLALLGEVVAEKEDIDPQFELAWKDEAGNRARVVFIATDTFFNRKNDENSEYHEQPFTYFAEGKWKLSEHFLVSGWFNWNTELELEYGDGSRFSYDQLMYEAAALWMPADEWQLLLSAGSQAGERALAGPRAGPEREQFDRDNVVVTLESQYAWRPDLQSFHGYHYFFLNEEGRYHNILPRGGELRRDEQMAYGGIIWNMSERFTFSPGVYFDFIDNNDAAREDDQEGEGAHKLLAKLTAPIEYAFSPRARVAVNTTAELHKANFGGFNLQFLILF